MATPTRRTPIARRNARPARRAGPAAVWTVLALAAGLLPFAAAGQDAGEGAAGTAGAPAATESPTALRARADAAYQNQEWTACADLYAAAAEPPGRRPDLALYNAACCAARAGTAERALDLLGRAVAAGARNAEHVRTDPDLVSLHDHPRWPAAVEAVEAAERAFAARVHPELYRMFEEDQADRRTQPIDWSVVTPRDEQRRRRAAEILDAGEAKAPEDYLHAGFIFQHGHEPADYARAEALARKALEVDPGFDRARWLVAAAHDRWRHSRGEPQVYGTQFRKGEDGRWSLDPIDPDAVTDAERAEYGVPPLAESRARAEAMNH